MTTRIIVADCRDALRAMPEASVHCVVTHAGKHVGMAALGPMTQPNRMPLPGLKPKDLIGIPWRVAFALQDNGWWLRQDIVWAKPNPMPESVRDRCTKSHEYVFLLAKSGRTLLWRHRDGRWTSAKPKPDLVWRHRETREESTEPRDRREWARVNLWRGHDYYYDAEAIMEPSTDDTIARSARGRSDDHKWADGGPGDQTIAKISPSAGRVMSAGNYLPPKDRGREEQGLCTAARIGGAAGWRDAELRSPMRNKRSVWTVATEAFPGAHFATFPTELIRPAILAGCPSGGLVLDPFAGAGTTGLVADRLGRDSVLVERNPSYAEMARRRILDDAPLLSSASVEQPIAEAAE